MASATSLDRAGSLHRIAPVIASIASGAVLAGTAVAVSFSIGDLAPAGDDADFLSGATGFQAFWVILMKNLAVAALLYSGVMTGGVSTLVGIPSVGFAVGAFASASATRHGWPALVEAVITYAPVELVALAVAGGAGLLPSMAAAVPALQEGRGPVDRYIRAMGRTLPLAALSIGLLVVGALVEAIVISSR